MRHIIRGHLSRNILLFTGVVSATVSLSAFGAEDTDIVAEAPKYAQNGCEFGSHLSKEWQKRSGNWIVVLRFKKKPGSQQNEDTDCSPLILLVERSPRWKVLAQERTYRVEKDGITPSSGGYESGDSEVAESIDTAGYEVKKGSFAFGIRFQHRVTMSEGSPDKAEILRIFWPVEAEDQGGELRLQMVFNEIMTIHQSSSPYTHFSSTIRVLPSVGATGEFLRWEHKYSGPTPKKNVILEFDADSSVYREQVSLKIHRSEKAKRDVEDKERRRITHLLSEVLDLQLCEAPTQDDPKYYRPKVYLIAEPYKAGIFDKIMEPTFSCCGLIVQCSNLKSVVTWLVNLGPHGKVLQKKILDTRLVKNPEYTAIHRNPINCAKPKDPNRSLTVEVINKNRGRRDYSVDYRKLTDQCKE